MHITLPVALRGLSVQRENDGAMSLGRLLLLLGISNRASGLR